MTPGGFDWARPEPRAYHTPMARVPAATVTRLLAGLLTFAVLLTASPLPLLQAAVAAPVEEEADADAESASSTCPRRATGPGGPPGEPDPSARIAVEHFTPIPDRSTRRSPSAPFAPHPRC